MVDINEAYDVYAESYDFLLRKKTISEWIWLLYIAKTLSLINALFPIKFNQ